MSAMMKDTKEVAGAPEFKVTLGENRYGKAENRVVRIQRDKDLHNIQDLNVSCQLSGDFDDTHVTGDNSKVVPTDTQKNTIFGLSQKHPTITEPEALGLLICEHFIDLHEHVTKAEVRLEEYLWERITVDGQPHPRAFKKNTSYVRTARVVMERVGSDAGATKVTYVSSGLEKLTILKTGDSEFTGFKEDVYTSLKPDTKRIMATDLNASWRHESHDVEVLKRTNFANSFTQAHETLLDTFGGHHSLSLQQTMYQMGQDVLRQQPDLCAIKFALPNKHHFQYDLSRYGQENNGDVFWAADRPYGLIEAVIEREGASTEGPMWPCW